MVMKKSSPPVNKHQHRLSELLHLFLESCVSLKATSLGLFVIYIFALRHMSWNGLEASKSISFFLYHLSWLLHSFYDAYFLPYFMEFYFQVFSKSKIFWIHTTQKKRLSLRKLSDQYKHAAWILQYLFCFTTKYYRFLDITSNLLICCAFWRIVEIHTFYVQKKLRVCSNKVF